MDVFWNDPMPLIMTIIYDICCVGVMYSGE
jgi:hypothetical protein